MTSRANCSHDHAHEMRETSTRRLTFALVLITGYMVAEVVGGILSGSLALLADAGHMLTDAASIALALAAMRFATRKPSARRTWGYHRLEVLAALANALALCVISAWIVFEAWQRFGSPPEVQAGLVLGVGSVGLAVNVAAAGMLHGSARENLNVEGAYRHVIADLLGSVAVILSGVLVWAFGWYLADPILSVVIGVLILVSAWRLLAKTVHVLLEGTPDRIDVSHLCDTLIAVDGVTGVHDVHVWTLASGYDALTAHVMVDPDHSSRRDELLDRLRTIAYEHFDLQHVTLQLETGMEACLEHHQAERSWAANSGSLTGNPARH